MNLNEIKEKVISELSQLTIDDIYSEPNIAERLLSEIIQVNGRDNIKEFLGNQLPKKINNNQRILHEKRIIELTNLKTLENKEIKSAKSDLETFEKKIVLLKEKQNGIQIANAKITSEIEDIELEIIQLKPLAGKIQYEKQIKELDETKKRKKIELEKLPIQSSNLDKELKEVQENITNKLNKIEEKEKKVKSIIEYILNDENEVNRLTEEENNSLSIYQEEEATLYSLFGILGEDYIFRGYRTDSVLNYLINKNEIPKEWRKIILQIFSNPIKEIEGHFIDLFERKEFNTLKEFFIRRKENLSIEDISTLLATKMAVGSNHSLIIGENKIALGLSGGIMAIITFRKKGELINKSQQQSLEIYIKYNLNYSERFSKKTLYYQTGYANSEIQILLPNQYYILSESYVIEIEYAPAPILFDNSKTVRLNTNISGIAEKEDDEEAMEDYYSDDDD